MIQDLKEDHASQPRDNLLHQSIFLTKCSLAYAISTNSNHIISKIVNQNIYFKTFNHINHLEAFQIAQSSEMESGILGSYLF